MPPSLTNAEALAHCTVRLALTYADGRVGTATGFFYGVEDGDNWFPVIVTNRHAMTDAVDIQFHLTTAEGDGPGTQHGSLEMKGIQSYWFGHPDPTIDLAVIPAGPLLSAISSEGSRLFTTLLRRAHVPTGSELAQLSPADPVLMIGYPNGIWDRVNNRPVYRRGIAATHPALNYNGKPVFLIDAACFPGSSGSPVFLHDLTYYDRDLGAMVSHPSGSRTRLLGILNEGPTYAALGEIDLPPDPTRSLPATVTPIVMHLGEVIRAEKLFDFDSVIKALIES